MKLKRLFLATGIALAFVTLFSLVVPTIAGTGYYSVEHGDSAFDWVCRTWVECEYTTPGYTINYPQSDTNYQASGFWGTSCTINSWGIEENSVFMGSSVTATYDPLLGDTMTRQSYSWAYPGQTSNPTGGFYREW